LNNKDLTEFIIQSLLEYIEIWDEALQMDFSNSIYKIFFVSSISEIYNDDFHFNSTNENLLFVNIKELDQKSILTIYYNTQNIINPLLKFLMKIISSTDERNLVRFIILRLYIKKFLKNFFNLKKRKKLCKNFKKIIFNK